jgi:ribosome maturation factor RimP
MTSVYEQEKTLQREISEEVERRLPGVEVLAVELAGRERFCVYLDHPDGVDHALCERVSNVLRGYLDRYAVEVSSPGFERPLRTRRHFEDVLGRKVAVRTRDEIDGRKRFRGKLVAAGDEALTLQTTDNHSVEIAYEAIARGNLIEGQET